MSLEILAGSVASVLATYLIKGGEEFAKEAGKESFQKVKQLYGTLKSHFSGNKAASVILADFEKEPAKHQGVLIQTLKDGLATDPTFAAQLEALLASLRINAPEVASMTIRAGTSSSIANETTYGDKVTVNVNAGRNVYWKK